MSASTIQAANKRTGKSAPTQGAAGRQQRPVASPRELALGQGVHLSPQDGSNPTTPAATRKRKPRKLNRATTASSAAATSSKPDETAEPGGVMYNIEIETLKSRIQDLELQVDELYQKALPGLPPKQPRRRGRGRGPPPPGSPEELLQLESELAATQDELAHLRTQKRPTKGPKKSQKAAEAAKNDDVEEIPRVDGPVAETQAQQRQVTLAGSYRIPLPSTVSLDDVKTIQSGINSANNVARSFMDAHRAQKIAGAATQTRNPVAQGTSSTRGQSWSEWIGGYSMVVARAVNSIEHSEQIRASPAGHPRPSAGNRRRSAPSGASSPAASAAAPANKARRPPLAATKPGSGDGDPSRGLSQQQTETLMA